MSYDMIMCDHVITLKKNGDEHSLDFEHWRIPSIDL